MRQHRVPVRKCTHAWPLLLKRESNKSFQTALERRGDTTRSKQPPEVTPLLLQRHLQKLRAGAGTTGMRHDRRRKLTCQQVPFSRLQAGSSPPRSEVTGLPFESNANYQPATLLPRSDTTNVRKATFHREVKYSLFCT